MKALIRSESPDARDMSNERAVELFLDYFNNYLSVERFAEHHGWLNIEAKEVIERGRKLHESNVIGPRIGDKIIDSRNDSIFGIVSEVKDNICYCDNDEDKCFIWRFYKMDKFGAISDVTFNNIFKWIEPHDR